MCWANLQNLSKGWKAWVLKSNASMLVGLDRKICCVVFLAIPTAQVSNGDGCHVTTKNKLGRLHRTLGYCLKSWITNCGWQKKNIPKTPMKPPKKFGHGTPKTMLGRDCFLLVKWVMNFKKLPCPRSFSGLKQAEVPSSNVPSSMSKGDTRTRPHCFQFVA